MAKYFLTSAISLLSGCAMPAEHWKKPNANLNDLYAVDQLCTVKAYKAAPTNMQTSLVAQGHYSPMQTNCQSTGGDGTFSRSGNSIVLETDPINTSCTSSGGQYIPPVYRQVDVNENYREKLRTLCMNQNGWARGTGILGLPLGQHRNGVALSEEEK